MIDKTTLTNEQYIKALEERGIVDPNCKMCQEIYYPLVREGKNFTSIFAPRHKPSDKCKSGKLPHCTCDTCF